MCHVFIKVDIGSYQITVNALESFKKWYSSFILKCQYLYVKHSSLWLFKCIWSILDGNSKIYKDHIMLWGKGIKKHMSKKFEDPWPRTILDPANDLAGLAWPHQDWALHLVYLYQKINWSILKFLFNWKIDVPWTAPNQKWPGVLYQRDLGERLTKRNVRSKERNFSEWLWLKAKVAVRVWFFLIS